MRRARSSPMHQAALGLGRQALLLCLLLIGLALASTAHAANYRFPSAMPAGCSGTAGTYSCGSVTLGSSDTVTIDAPKPATINFTALNTNGAQINTAGLASELSLVVSGTLTVGSGASIKANISAASVSNSAGTATIVGNLSTTGAVTLASYTTLTGNINVTAGGTVLVQSNGVVTGNISITTGWVRLNADAALTGSITTTTAYVEVMDRSSVGGSISAGGYVYVYSGGQVGGSVTTPYLYNAIGNAVFGGSIISTSVGVELGSNSTVAGSISATTGNINLYGHNTVSGGISCDCSIYAYGSTTVLGDITATYLYNPSVGNGNFGGHITTTTGGVYLGTYSTVAGNISATTGPINLLGNNTVGGGISCSCTVNAYSATNVAGGITANAVSNTGASPSTFGASVRATSGDVTLANNSHVAGEAISDTNNVVLNSGASVAQCVRSRSTSGIDIYLYSGSSAGGVCCGVGSCGTSCVFNLSGSAMPSACGTTYPAPLAVYLMNESGFSGTTGEVADSSGNGWHATAASLSATKPTTANTTPANSANPGTCGYGVFNRANKDYLALPSGFPDLGANGSFSVTAWIRSTDVSQPAQRIFADDQNSYASQPEGWALSLGDGGSGKLRFLTRRTATESLDTGAVISNNTWYFVAATLDKSSKTKRLYVYNAAGSQLAAVSATYSESNIGTDTGNASIGGENNNAAGGENTGSFGFGGNIDELRVFSAALNTTELAAVRALASSCAYGTLVAEYHFEEPSYSGAAGELKDTAGYSGGPFNGKAQGSALPGIVTSSPARSGSTGTCGYANLPGPTSNGGSFLISGLPVSTSTGATTSVSFWMYWTGGNDNVVMGFNQYDLWLVSGWFGFNTNNNDVFGIPSAGLANGWHHVVAVFSNGSFTSNRLYIDGVLQTLSQGLGSPNMGNATVGTSLTIGGYGFNTSHRFAGQIDQVKVYNGTVSAAQVAALYAETHACPSTGPDHLQIEHDGNGLTCTPETVTVKACANAACSSLYTSGAVSGNLAWSGGATGSAAFSIASGSSSTTVSVPVAAIGSVSLATSGVSPSISGASTCLNTSTSAASCALAFADTGFIFDVPDHRAEASQSFTITAVRKSDSAAVCVPAFQSVSKSVNFKCSYTDPGSGTLPVRVAGSALNAGNSTAAACDGTGRSVSLSFDGTGAASASLLYADVGRLQLTATYTGSGADAGLSMTGGDSFVVAPYDFAVSGISASAIAAGSNFSATVTARNFAGAATPNFGRETAPESATLGFFRTLPSGSAAVTGTFSGNVGSFSNGVATGSNLNYSEVGHGNVSALLTSGSYLGSGQTLAGSSEGALVWCGNEGDTCVLPTGSTVTMYYQAWGTGRTKAVSGLSGSVSCTNATFGDPYPGWGKGCSYAVTSGRKTWATGAALFKPHHFTVSVTQACPAGGFTYAGQPFSATVTAVNAAGAPTQNYDGSFNTSPNYAKAVTLSDAAASGLGSFSGNSLAATSFALGVATASPSYSFTAKLTGPQSLALRATDTDSVSSIGYAEGTAALRSGRLAVSNAFGRASASLQVPLAAQYWSGNAWVPNSADSCTSLVASNLVLSNPRNNLGGVSTATTSATVSAFAGGNANITLAAPGPAGSALSLDLALNLGSTSADQSCLTLHPSSTGAAMPWLRSRNGNCVATYDRDPAGRASFGIFAPESRRTVQTRNIY